MSASLGLERASPEFDPSPAGDSIALVGASTAMTAVRGEVARAARHRDPVLITGPTRAGIAHILVLLSLSACGAPRYSARAVTFAITADVQLQRSSVAHPKPAVVFPATMRVEEGADGSIELVVFTPTRTQHAAARRTGSHTAALIPYLQRMVRSPKAMTVWTTGTFEFDETRLLLRATWLVRRWVDGRLVEESVFAYTARGTRTADLSRPPPAPGVGAPEPALSLDTPTFQVGD